MNVDKSHVSCALLNTLKGKNKLGFGLNENGKIIPVNEGAFYNYNLGMETIVNLLEAQAQWQKAYSDKIDALTDLKIKESNYLRVTNRFKSND